LLRFQADKLTNGLEKIDDTRVKVEAMGKDLQVTQIEVAEFQKECDEYLVIIVGQKKEAGDGSHASRLMIFQRFRLESFVGPRPPLSNCVFRLSFRR
jgi:hypothetical protein